MISHGEAGSLAEPASPFHALSFGVWSWMHSNIAFVSGRTPSSLCWRPNLAPTCRKALPVTPFASHAGRIGGSRFVTQIHPFTASVGSDAAALNGRERRISARRPRKRLDAATGGTSDPSARRASSSARQSPGRWRSPLPLQCGRWNRPPDDIHRTCGETPCR